MSTFPFLLSVADELDNLNSQTYMDDFGLGFHPHRTYYTSPSIQLSLPASTEWFDGEEKKKRDYHIDEESECDTIDQKDQKEEFVDKIIPNHEEELNTNESMASSKSSLDFLSCFSTKRKNIFHKINK